MANRCVLTFDPDRGLELDLELDHEDIALRMSGIPVPADGKEALRSQGVELAKLEILFKAQASIDGSPGQLQEAAVQLVEADQKLRLDSKIEDVENGLLYPLEFILDLEWRGNAPESGGPVAMATEEDDLDWDDETTYEHLVVDLPDPEMTLGRDDAPVETTPPPRNGPTGLKALLEAIQSISDEEGAGADTEAPPLEDMPPLPPVETQSTPESEEGPGSQLMTAEGEALEFLNLLISREELELEEDFGPKDLSKGLAPLLQMTLSPERKAKILSDWLLEQSAVADLFIDDESLEALLSAW